MRWRGRLGCLVVVVLVALLAVWYGARYSGPWVARSPATRYELPEISPFSAVDLWRDPLDPSLLAVSWFESGSASPLLLIIDPHSGARRRATLSVDELRSHYERLDDARAPFAVDVQFRGVHLRRPRPYLVVFPGPGGPGVEWEHSLFGTIALVERSTGRVLLSRRVINGDRIPEVFEMVRLSGDSIAVISRDPVWTVWLFGPGPSGVLAR